MWTARTLFAWVKSGRREWQLFHHDCVFDAVILPDKSGRTILRYHYRGELYDEQSYPTRAAARQHAAEMRRKLTALGWREQQTIEVPASAHSRT
jgi:hypothetical protein